MTSPSDCVFCKIVAGQIPSTRIHETENLIAFLDIAPLAKGHALLIPKRHFEQIAEMSPELAGEIGAMLPRMTAAVISAATADGCNILQNNGRLAGQVVPHVHFHIIPRCADDGLGYRWNTTSYAVGEAGEMAEKLRGLLS
jgi:histidine triad (HIT) family protein